MQPAHPEAVDQGSCETIRAPRAQLTGERDDHHALGAGTAEQLDAIDEAAEQRRATGRIDDASRMRVERDRDRGHRGADRGTADAPEESLMPDVNAVEAADRHHRPGAARTGCRELVEQFHRDVSRPAPWSAGSGRR